MPIIVQKKKAASLGSVLSAAKKLTPEDKQILRMRLFADEGIKEMKDFEAILKKDKKNILKKKDKEIVSVVKKIRVRNGRV